MFEQELNKEYIEAVTGILWYYHHEVIHSKENLQENRKMWKKINKVSHNPISGELFINGILYYEYKPLRKANRWKKPNREEFEQNKYIR